VSGEPSRRLDRLLAAAAASFVAALAGSLVALGVRVTEEDGFYYLKIAQHLASGHGSTFDGLHPTSGYQPLWLLVLAPVFWLRPSAAAAILIATAMQAVLLALAAALLYTLARTWLSPAAAMLAVMSWILLAYRPGLSGVEFALLSLLACALALVLARGFTGGAREDTRSSAVTGALLAALVLARIDHVLLAVLAAAQTSRRSMGRSARAGLALMWLPMLVAGGVYVAVNSVAFGHPLPVSGLAKRAWSEHLLHQDPIVASAGWPAAKAVNLMRPLRHPAGAGMIAVVLGGFLPGVLLLARAAGARPRFADLLEPLRPLALFAALQPVVYALAYHGHYSWAPWYYAVQPLLAALLVASVLSAAASSLRRPWPGGERLLAALAAAVALAIVFHAARLRHAPSADGPLYRAARWARDNLGGDARVGTWHAGAIGFLSGRQVVNLDGVVNTVDYFRREQYDQCAYWDRTGLTHLVDVFEAREGSTTVIGGTLPSATFYSGCTQRLELLWSDRMPGNPGWPKAFRIRRASELPQ
jgi:hypothetical protein